MRFKAAVLFLTFVAAGQGQTPLPSILPGGVVPLDSSAPTIQPGEWVSIFGTGLASQTTIWKGEFPVSLGGTSVEIDGKPAYLWYVSPGQINLQAPDDTATGTVPVVVTTANGSATSTVTLAPFAPSFLLLDSEHVTGIILRQNGSGAYGGGSYDVIGPTGFSLGYQTVAANAGDLVELFGVGFGPTRPAPHAGQAFAGAAPTTSPVTLLINSVSVTPSFAGLAGAGLYQINFTVPPNAGSGDVPLVATVGGTETPSGVVISLQAAVTTSQVQSLTLSANTLAAGGAITGTVTLSSVVPFGTAVVALSSSSGSVSVPASVAIPAGSASAKFTVSAGTVSSSQTVTITASYGGTLAQATLTTTSPPVLSFSTLTITGTWMVAGYTKISVEWTLQPDSGASTWTASGGNLFPTFTGCSASNGNATIACGTVAPSPENYLVTTVGLFLNVSTGSLDFTITPNAPFSNTGTFGGTLSVKGTTSSGATQSYSGPLTGDYYTTP